MKFEIFDETRKPEPVCRFKLINTGYGGGGITLVAVDERGEALAQGEIVSLYSNNGTIRRHTNCVVPGIKTDKEGRIIEEIKQ